MEPMMKSLLNDWPTYIAHRGASTLAPENSLAAFAKARELGYRASSSTCTGADGRTRRDARSLA
jgi:hypothetical protein